MKLRKIKSAQETKQFAASFAKKLSGKRGVVIALSGDLGSGKTTFTQGFSKGLGIKEKIISPTFVLMREHPLPNSNAKLYHLDLYRLEEGVDFNQLGLEELFQDPKNFILIEWAERIEKILPAHAIKIHIQKVNTNERIIKIT